MSLVFSHLAVFVFSMGQAFGGELVDRIIAVVGSEMITLSDVKKKGAVSKQPLDDLIQEKLMEQEISRLKLTVSQSEKQAAISDVLQRNGMTLEELRRELAAKGTPWTSYEQELEEQVKKMKFIGQVIYPRIKISDDDILRESKGDKDDEARLRARYRLLQARAPDELKNYLNEVREKSYIEIKK